MAGSSTRHHEPRRAPRSAAAAAQAGEFATGEVVIEGDRHGVVSRVGPGWTRVTGLSLGETLDKPITHFLERAGIELDLVDFVACHFLEGRSCRVEFPFDAAHGRRVRIHLDVEPVRDAEGDVTGFLARAHERDEMPDTRLESESCPDRASGSGMPGATAPAPAPTSALDPATDPRGRAASGPDPLPGLDSLLRRRRRALSARITLEACLGPGLPARLARDARLTALLASLLDAAEAAIGEGWGAITIATGVTSPGRAHASAAHPIATRPAALARAPHGFLEVHASGDLEVHASGDLEVHASGDLAARASGADAGRARAGILARALGASLHVSDAPGCGRQLLVLFPVAPIASEGADDDPRADREAAGDDPPQAMYMPPFTAST